MRKNALYCVLAVLINPSLLWHFAKVNFLFSWSRNLRCLKRRTLLEADPAMELFVTIVYCWKQIAKLKQYSYQKWYWKLRSKSFKCYIQFNIILHVIRMSFLCYSYVLACHLYVTCIISFVICMSLICGFNMNPLIIMMMIIITIIVIIIIIIIIIIIAMTN